MRRLAAEEAPFFLYVAHVAPHWPLQAKEQDVAKYREVYAKGWEALREGRERRLRESGMLDAGWPLSPRYLIVPDNPHPETWEDVRNREWEIERMSVYAAQVDALDQGVGRLMKAIEDSGEADNTLVIFLSDNGGLRRGRAAGVVRHPQPHARRAGDPHRQRPENQARPRDDLAELRPRGGRTSRTRRSGCSSTGRTRGASPRR